MIDQYPCVQFLATPLNSGSCQRILPDTENVQSTVYVPVMDRAALTAPFSYTQVFSTLWAANCTAARTNLSRKRFVHFEIFCTRVIAFVCKHRSEGTPARVQNGFSHPGFSKLGTVDVADKDQIVIGNNIVGNFVQEVSPLGCDLHIDVGSLSFLSRPLSLGKFNLSISKILRGTNLFSSGECGQVLKAQIDSHGPLGGPGFSGGQFKDQIQIPSSTGILREIRPITNLGTFWDRPGKTDGIKTLMADKLIARLSAPFSSNGNPAKGFFSTVAKIRLAVLKTRTGILLANSINYLCLNSKIFTGTSRKLAEIKPARPAFAPTQCVPLSIVTEIPNKINFSRHAVQRCAMSVFYPISVSEFHTENLAIFGGQSNGVRRRA